ncbi:MAG TPA: ketopantoate reductase C-terminal domain-containing protein, partial [Burkholderiales bacterium]|nr:ketopantoate reductase C-terminal domain-containing protein [Burkholderiales bacterium]
RVQIRLAAEAIRIGAAYGYQLEAIRGLPAGKWIAAADGDAAAIAEVEQCMLDGLKRRPEGGRSGTAQDLSKHRRTEVDFMNGFIAEKGVACGLPAPTHAAIASLVRRIELGDLMPSRAMLDLL